MLRGLGLRESNSVCGRAIQKENGGNPRDAKDYSHDQKLDGGNSSTTSQSRPDKIASSIGLRKQRIVRCLDVAETPGRPGKYIQFKARLHPWITIKELKQHIYALRGYHVHRQRLFLNNSELLNSETLDYYGLLQEQDHDDLFAQDSNNINPQNITDAQAEQIEIDEIKKNLQEQKAKIVILRLAPNLAKLSQLNRINIQKSEALSGQDKLKDGTTLPVGNIASHGDYQDHDASSTCIEMFGSMECPAELTGIITDIVSGFQKGLKPKLTDDGTSGTYILRGARKQALAAFKPIDEEAFAPNNPRDHVGPFGSNTFRAGVLSGEACIREVTAYLLDKDGFSGVPPTTMVETAHDSFKTFKFKTMKIVVGCNDYKDMISSIVAPENLTHNNDQGANHERDSSGDPTDDTTMLKIGSLQSFVKSEGPIENFSSDLFSEDEIHKIAILDLRILNLDRNECNILVQSSGIFNQDRADDGSSISQGSFDGENSEFHESGLTLGSGDDASIGGSRITRKLIPIDHGLSIPDTLAVCSYDLIWLSYDQANKPFSKKSLDYIKSIDYMADIRMLEQTFKFRSQCLRNMRISSTLLKKGAAAGLTLSGIGRILCRPDEDDTQPSVLEQIVRRARMCANMMAQVETRIKDSNLRLILPTFQQTENGGHRRYSMADNSLLDEDDDLLDVNFINNDSTSMKLDMNSMDMDTSGMLNLKSSLKQQDKGREVRRGRTDSSLYLPEFGSAKLAAAIDPILEVEHGRKGYNDTDHHSPISKFEDIQEKDGRHPLRIVPEPVPQQQHGSPTPHAPATASLQAPCLKNELLVMRQNSSVARKRGYSDIDQNTFQAFQLNATATFNKKLDQKFKAVPENAASTGKDKVEEKDIATSKHTGEIEFKEVARGRNRAREKVTAFDSSSSGSQDNMDLGMFKGFEYSAHAHTSMASAASVLASLQQDINNYETGKVQGTLVNNEINQKESKIMVDNRDKLAQKVETAATTMKISEKKQNKEPVKFSQAVRKLNNKLVKTLPEMKTSKIHKFRKDDASKAFPRKAVQINNSNWMRRTTSFAGIQITEESEEEDTPLKFVDEKDKKPYLTTIKQPQNSFFVRKNESYTSLLSQASNTPSNNGGFRRGLTRTNRPSFNDSKIDQLRYFKQRRHHIFSGNNNIYKQRNAKLNLERDMKWNGPHDQAFFRCFEQYLDEAIKKLVQSQKYDIVNTDKEREKFARKASRDNSAPGRDQPLCAVLEQENLCGTKTPVAENGSVLQCVVNPDTLSNERRSLNNSKQDSRGTRSSS